jgi:hypothetical protein
MSRTLFHVVLEFEAREVAKDKDGATEVLTVVFREVFGNAEFTQGDVSTALAELSQPLMDWFHSHFLSGEITSRSDFVSDDPTLN